MLINWDFSYNYSYWFTIMAKYGNKVLNESQEDVLVRTQWKQDDITPQIEIIDLSTLNNNDTYYFMVIYTYVLIEERVKYPPAPQSLYGQVYSLKNNGKYSLSLLKEITFIDSINPPIHIQGTLYMANQFCVNILNKKDNIFSLIWTQWRIQCITPHFNMFMVRVGK